MQSCPQQTLSSTNSKAQAPNLNDAREAFPTETRSEELGPRIDTNLESQKDIKSLIESHDLRGASIQWFPFLREYREGFRNTLPLRFQGCSLFTGPSWFEIRLFAYPLCVYIVDNLRQFQIWQGDARTLG